MRPKLIIGGFIGLLFFIVLIQNTEVVSLRFLIWEVSMSRIVLLPLVLLLGIIIGFFIGRKSWDIE